MQLFSVYQVDKSKMHPAGRCQIIFHYGGNYRWKGY